MYGWEYTCRLFIFFAERSRVAQGTCHKPCREIRLWVLKYLMARSFLPSRIGFRVETITTKSTTTRTTAITRRLRGHRRPPTDRLEQGETTRRPPQRPRRDQEETTDHQQQTKRTPPGRHCQTASRQVLTGFGSTLTMLSPTNSETLRLQPKSKNSTRRYSKPKPANPHLAKSSLKPTLQTTKLNQQPQKQH